MLNGPSARDSDECGSNRSLGMVGGRRIAFGLRGFLREISEETRAFNSEDQMGGREDSTEGMIDGGGWAPGSVRRGFDRT